MEFRWIKGDLNKKSPILGFSTEPIQSEMNQCASLERSLRGSKSPRRRTQTGGSTKPEHDTWAFQRYELAWSPEGKDNWMFFKRIFSQGTLSLQANFIAFLVADVPLIFLKETWSTFTAEVCIPHIGRRITADIQKMHPKKVIGWMPEHNCYLVRAWAQGVAVILVDDDRIWDVFHGGILEINFAGKPSSSLVVMAHSSVFKTAGMD